jgi:pimeloyl-ACP methyl ester carboxylesterase
MEVLDHIDSGGLAGVLEGTPDARAPLVLLHGLTFDRVMWQPALAGLRAADPGRQVLALDLPGHGDSPAWPRYDVGSVADAVYSAVRQAGLSAPVVVGHSLGAIVAMDYAARYPARGVVNVDQWLQVEPFITLAKSLAGEIRGSGFAAAWQRYQESMHLEVLPAQTRRLLRPTGSVRQEVVAGYWREGLDQPVHEFAARVGATIARLRASQVSYLFIAGHAADAEYLAWIGRQLPQVVVETWPGSGHFPHLAHPAWFAACLAATAQWTAAPQDGAA